MYRVFGGSDRVHGPIGDPQVLAERSRVEGGDSAGDGEPEVQDRKLAGRDHDAPHLHDGGTSRS